MYVSDDEMKIALAAQTITGGHKQLTDAGEVSCRVDNVTMDQSLSKGG